MSDSAKLDAPATPPAAPPSEAGSGVGGPSITPAAPAIDPGELAKLQAAAAKLAEIEAKQAEAERAESIKRGEYDKVIATLKAEAEQVKATAARQAEDLALVGVHAGLATEDARAVMRALYGALPEGKRAPTLAEQVKAWAKKPDEAPPGARAYLAPATTAPTAPTGSSAKGAAGADTEAVLRWARETGRFPSHRTPNDHEAAALARIYAKKKAG